MALSEFRIIRGKPWLETLLLLASDLFVFVIVIGLVSWFRYLLFPSTYHVVFTPQDRRTIYYVLIFSVLMLAVRGLYPGWLRSSVVELKQIMEAVTLAFVLTSVIIFIQGASIEFSRSVFLLSWLFAILLLPIGRFVVRRWISRFSWWGEPAVIIGKEERITSIAKRLSDFPRLGLRPVAGLALGERISAQTSNIPLVTWSMEAQRQIQNSGVKVNVLAISTNELRNAYPQVFEQVAVGFRKTVFLIEDDIYGSMLAQPVDIAGQSALFSQHSLLNPTIRLVKQWVSLVFSLLFLVPSLAIGLLIACWIRIDSPGPIFIKQERVGRYQKKFWIYKFRTMVQNADEVLKRLLEDPQNRSEWEHFHKLSRDTRVTRSGKWLRRLSLDELPQFINILRGEMHLIGPRPYFRFEIDEMGEAAEFVLRVHPGLTGWWQVMGRNDLSFQERIQMDLYYVLNWSLWLDLFIMIKTIRVMLFDRSGK